MYIMRHATVIHPDCRKRGVDMTLAASVAPLLTHFVPIVFFVHMLTDLLSRSRKKAEYLLVSGIVACVMSMFLEEFVRHYLPLEFSPILTASWFALSGITIVGLGLHLFVKLTHFGHKFPKIVYPYLFYLPTVLVALNLIFNDQMISGGAFYQAGIWKMPVYNTAYYIAMFGSNLFNVLYLAILWRGIANSPQKELRGIYRHLMYGVLVTVFFNLIGTIDFRGYLPPYPYIYGSLLWCVLLRQTMRKYEFLNHADIRFEKVFNMSPAAIVLTDLEGNVKEANPAARKLFEAMNIGPGNISPLLQGELRHRIESRLSIQDVSMSMEKDGVGIELVIDGDYVSVEYKPHLILIMRDVTAQMASQRELEFIAYHDMLTKLPNRKHFFEQLDRALERAGETGERVAVMMFDLDHFKEINDKCGHLAGDQALVQVADAIRGILTGDEFAARLGGDEFIIFFRSADEERVKEKIGQLQQELAGNPLVAGGERHPLRISVGVSFCPDQGGNSDTLINWADKALYHAKRSGRGRCAFASELE
jgi:diguanylate cyclase (GGDEF)-like protein/PAS domain S-box-containing protein